MNYVKKLNLHWFCTQNHILEPFSVRRACTKSYVTSEPYPRASQIWCQNVRGTWKKKVIKCRGESFARCRVIARNVEGGPFRPPPSLFRVNPKRAGGGGGGGIRPPPSTFRAIISWNFFSRHELSWLFSFKSCATFGAIFGKIGRTVPKLRNIM